MKKYKVGYTQGVFDMFHIGHLNLIKRAKDLCETLIVGVNSDKLVESYKHKSPMIPQDQRREIVGALKYVDKCVIVETLDKTVVWGKYKFDAIIIGSDWKGNERWIATEKALAEKNAEVVYVDYTEGISSSLLRKRIQDNK